MRVAMFWTDLEVLSRVRIFTVMQTLMDGRKDKRVPTRVNSRQIPIGEPRLDLHPISLMILYRDCVLRFARSRNILRPKRVRQLPTETLRKFDSELKNAWWTQAVTDAAVSLPGHITAPLPPERESYVRVQTGCSRASHMPDCRLGHQR
jgi:hypothetical protein